MDTRVHRGIGCIGLTIRLSQTRQSNASAPGAHTGASQRAGESLARQHILIYTYCIQDAEICKLIQTNREKSAVSLAP